MKASNLLLIESISSSLTLTNGKSEEIETHIHTFTHTHTYIHTYINTHAQVTFFSVY